MRKYYLSKARYTKEYFLDSSRYGKNRIFLLENSSESLLKKLKSQFNLKRKSIIYVESCLEKEIISNLEKLIKNSKVSLKVVNDLSEY